MAFGPLNSKRNVGIAGQDGGVENSEVESFGITTEMAKSGRSSQCAVRFTSTMRAKNIAVVKTRRRIRPFNLNCHVVNAKVRADRNSRRQAIKKCSSAFLRGFPARRRKTARHKAGSGF
jgi:hypothetical protein